MTVRRDVFGHSGIAHTSLKGTLTSEHFSDGTLMRVNIPVADLRLDPAGNRLDRQILFGHPVRQLEDVHGLSRDETSGYVGHVKPDALAPWAPPTHRVSVRTSLLFREADIKSPQPMPLSQGTLLHIVEVTDRFARTDLGHFAIADHLTPHDQRHPDLAGWAEQLLGTPYLWGGNSAFGIDCSGLVQLACQAAHIACPGDSDQQCDRLGQFLPDGTPPERNDLFFWPGHVAIAVDRDTLIHANAHHMATAFEPIVGARSRIESITPLKAHKRL